LVLCQKEITDYLWGLPLVFIAFQRDNDIKSKFLRGNKVDILTKEVNAKTNWNQSQTYFGSKKAYFWGHPVIQAVEAKMLGPFCKIFIFLQNISFLFNQLRAKIIGGL